MEETRGSVTAVDETFAGYRIESVLGRGGMGTVYRARHPRLPRSVALKVLDPAVSADPEVRGRFEQEAAIVAGLEHPGIVGIFDRGADHGRLWISMPLIEGVDATRLDPSTPPDLVLRYIAETAAALDYAHGQGVLHRDVKPANILVAAPGTADSRAVLTDFGIARLVDSGTKLTVTGTFTATLAYASPEQLAGEVVDHRSDQYSLACTLYALLAGQPPFPATNPAQVIAGHLSAPVPRLSTARAGLAPALDAVLARAMAKRRAERFGGCGEFAAAARDALLYNIFPAQSVQSAAAGGAHTPRSAPAAEVSGGSAKAVAVISLVMGLIFGFIGLSMFGHLMRMQPTDTSYVGSAMTYDEDFRLSLAAVVATVPPAALSIVGGVALLLRRRAGRVLVCAGSVWLLLAAVGVAGFALVTGETDWLAAAGFIVILPLIVISGARSAETTRWLARRRQFSVPARTRCRVRWLSTD
ncbi:serine/threonine-protein kinase [Nocardia sp. NPDC058244]|uniref:serine/threonine-protein kinase n=1 Tax=Nocardia sp. NPDC058244 TaxID=3346398 RepID=UPI0036DB532E